MRIHKEGIGTILFIFILAFVINFFVDRSLIGYMIVKVSLLIISLAFFIFILSFFRKPGRQTVINAGEVLSPCDGNVVVIEETEESEYFKGRRIQVSIFMSPLNVHVNYNPITGEVKYSKYHPGKHWVAWHPKSSTDNERSSVVIADEKNEILVRQIAGAVARRIMTYSKPGQRVEAGKELGFIKFGSRVDVFFPPDAEILVKLNEKVKGGESVVGRFRT